MTGVEFLFSLERFGMKFGLANTAQAVLVTHRQLESNGIDSPSGVASRASTRHSAIRPARSAGGAVLPDPAAGPAPAG